MYRRDNKTKIITSLVLVLVLGLSLGFAAFSNTLRIIPQATITPDSAMFDVDFSSTNTGVVVSEITPTLTGTGITAESAIIDNSTNPTISNLSVNFTEPGQKAEYRFYAYNNGAYLAYLNSVNFLNAEGKDAFIICEAVDETTQYVSEACQGMKVTIQVGSLTTEETKENITGHSLAKQTAEEIVVTIEYVEDSARADGSFNVIFGDVTLVYTSADGIVSPEDPEPESYLGTNPCTYDGELTQGVEYTNGQYTYRYMQDGWGVTLTDKSSTDAVTTQLCSSISGKPIVSMSYMFSESNATSIDVSSFDTSNVTDMSYMFSGMSEDYDEETIIITGLTNFDTSNVTNMSWMFSKINTNVDVSNFDTSNVTNMSGMFAGSYTTISITGLQNFDTSNVTNMSNMFAFQSVVDLSTWDTSNVTNMSSMFAYGSVGDITTWNTSNVTDMSYMFAYGGGVSKDGAFDLSSFDTSNANLEAMFLDISVSAPAYARTQEDADRLNNTEVTYLEGNPFTVKQ